MSKKRKISKKKVQASTETIEAYFNKLLASGISTQKAEKMAGLLASWMWSGHFNKK